eukprot:gene8591-10201_t
MPPSPPKEEDQGLKFWRDLLPPWSNVPTSFEYAFRVGLTVFLAGQFKYQPFLAERFASGYGWWVVLTTLACAEFNVGAAVQKGFIRTVGTVIGCALVVLLDALLQDGLALGERKSLIVVLLSFFTSSLYFFRYSSNPDVKDFKQKLLITDYEFYVVALSFDLLLIKTFADGTSDPAFYRMGMTCVGYIITLAVTLAVFPQYAEDTCCQRFCDDLEDVSAILEASIGRMDQAQKEDDFNEVELDKTNRFYTRSAEEGRLIGYIKWEPYHRALNTRIKSFVYSKLPYQGGKQKAWVSTGTGEACGRPGYPQVCSTRELPFDELLQRCKTPSMEDYTAFRACLSQMVNLCLALEHYLADSERGWMRLDSKYDDQVQAQVKLVARESVEVLQGLRRCLKDASPQDILTTNPQPKLPQLGGLKPSLSRTKAACQELQDLVEMARNTASQRGRASLRFCGFLSVVLEMVSALEELVDALVTLEQDGLNLDMEIPVD